MFAPNALNCADALRTVKQVRQNQVRRIAIGIELQGLQRQIAVVIRKFSEQGAILVGRHMTVNMVRPFVRNDRGQLEPRKRRDKAIAAATFGGSPDQSNDVGTCCQATRHLQAALDERDGDADERISFVAERDCVRFIGINVVEVERIVRNMVWDVLVLNSERAVHHALNTVQE